MNEFIDLSKYEIAFQIGEGPQGGVYKLKALESDPHRVIKIFKKPLETEEISAEERKLLNSRIDLFLTLKYPAITKFIDFIPIYFNKTQTSAIVSELISSRSLGQVLKYKRENPKSKPFSDTSKLMVIYGIAKAMSFLHSHDVIHCNLKPQNVILDKHDHPYVTDFALSNYCHNMANMKNIDLARLLHGTTLYLPPEFFDKFQYTKEGDVYAYSMIVYEIMTNQKPFNNQPYLKVIKKIQRGIRPKLPDTIPEAYQNLMRKCWHREPTKRPTFDQIILELDTNEGFITESVEKSTFYVYEEMYHRLHEKKHKIQPYPFNIFDIDEIPDLEELPEKKEKGKKKGKNVTIGKAKSGSQSKDKKEGKNIELKKSKSQQINTKKGKDAEKDDKNIDLTKSKSQEIKTNKSKGDDDDSKKKEKSKNDEKAKKAKSDNEDEKDSKRKRAKSDMRDDKKPKSDDDEKNTKAKRSKSEIGEEKDSKAKKTKSDDDNKDSKSKKDHDKDSKSKSEKDKDSKSKNEKDKDSKSKSEKDKDSKSKNEKDKDSKSKNEKDKDAKSKNEKDKDAKSKSDKNKDSKSKSEKDKDAKSKSEKDKDSKSKSEKDKDAKSKNEKDKDSKSKSEKDKDAKSKSEKDKDSKSKSEKDKDAKSKNDNDDDTKVKNENDTKSKNENDDEAKVKNENDDDAKDKDENDDEAKVKDENDDDTKSKNENDDDTKDKDENDDDTKDKDENDDDTKDKDENDDDTKSKNENDKDTKDKDENDKEDSKEKDEISEASLIEDQIIDDVDIDDDSQSKSDENSYEDEHELAKAKKDVDPKQVELAMKEMDYVAQERQVRNKILKQDILCTRSKDSKDYDILYGQAKTLYNETFTAQQITTELINIRKEMEALENQNQNDNQNQNQNENNFQPKFAKRPEVNKNIQMFLGFRQKALKLMESSIENCNIETKATHALFLNESEPSIVENYYDKLAKLSKEAAFNNNLECCKIYLQLIENKKAVNDNHYEMGRLYEKASILEKEIRDIKSSKIDYLKAAEQYKKAANRNHMESMFRYAQMIEEGVVLTKKEAKGSEESSKKVDNDECAKKLYQKAASMGHPGSIYKCAVMLENDSENDKSNLARAHELYKKSALLNYPDAMYRYARILEDICMIKADRQKAVELYQKAANMNNVDAMFRYAQLLEQGNYVMSDKSKALDLYRKAATLADSSRVDYVKHYVEIARTGSLGGIINLEEANKYDRIAQELTVEDRQ